MKIRCKVLFYLLLLVLVNWKCISQEEQKREKVSYNVIVLLDLSDRILYPGQIARDKQIIINVFDEFKSKIRKDLYFASDDQFKVVIARQEGNPNSGKMAKLLDSLHIDMASVPLAEKKNLRDINIDRNLDQLYELGKYSDIHNDYKGADIVGYLRDDFTVDKKEGFVNKLVILSDGYLFVEDAHGSSSNWPSVTDLKKCDIAFFELNPSDYKSGELQKMKKRLSLWIRTMDPGEVILQHTSGMPTVLNSVKTFMQEKKKKNSK